MAVRLINVAWFRVGSDRYAKQSGTHGVTTLSRRHVKVRGNPAVVEQYLDGRTLAEFRPRHLRIVKARDIGLNPEEQALLSLLRSWRIKRALKAA